MGQRSAQIHHTFLTTGNTFVQTLLGLHYITVMNWLLRIIVFLVMGSVLLLFFAVALVAVLLSCLRWLLTGQKPSTVVWVNAAKRYKDMANSVPGASAPYADTIDIEVREKPTSPDSKPMLPK